MHSLQAVRLTILALLILGPALVPGAARADEIELIGTASIPGTALDLSNAKGSFDDGTSHNQIGGFSAIEYDTRRNRYLVLPDRGPADGAREYHCRFHEFEIQITPGASQPVSVELLATHMLTDETGRAFVGLAAAIDREHPELSLRFDPEGIRVGLDGAVYICDEYGPHLFAFSSDGRLQRRLSVPEHLRVKHPADSQDEEHAKNRLGRQTNRGFEGLAISSDGRRLYAMLQGPLLQDHPYDDHGDRLGLNCRLVEFDLTTGRTRELVYVLDRASHGISEVLMLDEHRILVLERDSKAGVEAKSKRLYEADFSRASDVSSVESLPATTLPEGVRPMSKRLFLDLLDERFGLTGDAMPAKVEGITFGPDLPDGRRLLIVCSDNDFKGSEPSRVYAFAIGGSAPLGVTPGSAGR